MSSSNPPTSNIGAAGSFSATTLRASTRSIARDNPQSKTWVKSALPNPVNNNSITYAATTITLQDGSTVNLPEITAVGFSQSEINFLDKYVASLRDPAVIANNANYISRIQSYTTSPTGVTGANDHNFTYQELTQTDFQTVLYGVNATMYRDIQVETARHPRARA